MGALSNVLNVLGLVFLSHAVYSAHEHSLLPRRPTNIPTSSSTSPQQSSHKLELPLDIILELCVSVSLLCIGIVLGSPELKPIEWRVWAGKLEREKRVETQSLDDGTVNNPYQALDERVGFLDIRAKRKEFATWVREGGQARK